MGQGGRHAVRVDQEDAPARVQALLAELAAATGTTLEIGPFDEDEAFALENDDEEMILGEDEEHVFQLAYTRATLRGLLQRLPIADGSMDIATDGAVEILVHPDDDGAGAWVITAEADVDPNHACWPLPIAVVDYLGAALGAHAEDPEPMRELPDEELN